MMSRLHTTALRALPSSTGITTFAAYGLSLSPTPVITYAVSVLPSIFNSSYMPDVDTVCHSLFCFALYTSVGVRPRLSFMTAPSLMIFFFSASLSCLASADAEVSTFTVPSGFSGSVPGGIVSFTFSVSFSTNLSISSFE